MQPSFNKASFDLLRLTEKELPEAVELLIEGMAENPTHRKVFDGKSLHYYTRLRRFFWPLLRYELKRGFLYGAYREGKLLALFGLFPPQTCRPRLKDCIVLIPILWANRSPYRVYLLLRWLFSWWWLDPKKPHWHLGPLVVAKPLQGGGLGPKLYFAVIQNLPSTSTHYAWLETDKKENVSLYQKLGFKVVRCKNIIGVKNWFMAGELIPQSYNNKNRVNKSCHYKR